ncbi:AcrR family transcriptional regulator [Pseudochelatococcus lubricantis]|uniref:AcrR family transcriptional regulator n=1 Tax=Pseudochelatococcus lubricantis TaxID=1538102 RepID=A0ABX0UYV4_9HYPH|nr:TetR/AcrR family transcriptional regulator [Pseudochelatococcus lubricantis]NIJ57464.1 AcrR family transcriptional regulator [Pseudochelatococcus lubricantis]
MGRPREFDVDEALDAALAVFWRKGFEGASYADLTQATGVERPALYAAYGNKEELFRLALQRYYERYMDYVPEGLKQPTSYDVAAYILRGAVELCTRYPDHTGCFGVNGALACSDNAEPIRKALIDARASGEAALRTRFERAKAEGDLPDTADSGTLAAYLMAILHGVAVQAKAGFSREVLMAVADQALSTWPSGRHHNV